MLRFPFSILFFLCCSVNSFAQNNRQWATYYGGTGGEDGNSVATDASGNVYVAGSTGSATGIASGGFQNIYSGTQDAFLVKFDAAGNRLWATYYGGTGQEEGMSVATDASGNVYLAGFTNSTSNISSGGFQNTYGGGSFDAFLVKFNAAGNRLWATYYGGTGAEYGYSITTDASGNVYLTGFTDSTSNISSGGFQNIYGGGSYDAFLVKFDVAGNRLWATYYGGTGDDRGLGVITDATGNVYLGGWTQSAFGIASSGFQNTYGGGIFDAFLVKFDAAGNRLWATYYGGTSDDYGNSVATDALGNVYLGGVTNSASNIASGGFQNIYGGAQDAFLVKFDAAGNRLWATYYGGTGIDEELSMATDASGNVFLGGDTHSPLGIASGGFQNSLVGYENAFAVKFDASGNRLCATYYGQSNEENNSIAVDGLGNLYVAGMTNSTSGIASGGFQNTFGGGAYDAYLVKFTSCCAQNFAVITGNTIFCSGQSDTLIATGGTNYLWSTGETTASVQVNPTASTNYSVVVSNGNCTDTALTSVTVNPNPTANVSGSINIFQGQSTTLTASGGGNYLWNTGETTIAITVAPTVTTVYCVTVTNTNNCFDTACVTVTIKDICTKEIYLPNAFSPNSDGENDFLQIYYGDTTCIKTFALFIYDRWGENIFASINPSFKWDGSYNGKIMNTQVLVYFLKATFIDNKEVSKKGNINLVK